MMWVLEQAHKAMVRKASLLQALKWRATISSNNSKWLLRTMWSRVVACRPSNNTLWCNLNSSNSPPHLRSCLVASNSTLNLDSLLQISLLKRRLVERLILSNNIHQITWWVLSLDLLESWTQTWCQAMAHQAALHSKSNSSWHPNSKLYWCSSYKRSSNSKYCSLNNSNSNSLSKRWC